MRRLTKVANAVMLVVFVSWAGFQYNDPDGVWWMVVYLLAAAGCGLAFFGRFPRRVALTYVGLCVGWALYLAVSVIFDSEFFFEERGREAMGLTICAAWMLVLWKATAVRSSDTIRSRESALS
ncbi:MAG: transmembrane 220 family protein [Rhodothermales bacterium]